MTQIQTGGSPTVLRMILARQLQALREKAGMSYEQAGEAIYSSEWTIRRMERAEGGLKPLTVKSLLMAYGITDPGEIGAFLALARGASKPGWWHSYDDVLPSWFRVAVGLEESAALIRAYEPQVVPGLLQTADYARSVMVGLDDVFPVPPGEIDRRVEARLLRQLVLDRDPPLKLSAVIDQSVLHRRLGDNSIMREQLKRLIVAAEIPSVTVQVLPLSGAQSITTGAFIYMKFAQVHDVPMHDMAIVENLAGNDYVEEDDDTFSYHRAFKALTRKALSPTESMNMIEISMREIWS